MGLITSEITGGKREVREINGVRNVCRIVKYCDVGIGYTKKPYEQIRSCMHGMVDSQI